MSLFLGVDTSNYTTSAALYDDETGEVTQRRRLLAVKPGEKGLRQSNALFAHVKNLPDLLCPLLEGRQGDIAAVGVSARPRDLEDSYMPCFEAGVLAGRSAAAALKVRCFDFSHQAGHIAAALYSIGRLDLLERDFVAFHVSGGTTEAVFCSPGGAAPKTTVVARALDLKAGQAVDRVGLLLGLSFPAGPQLEEMALRSTRHFACRPCLKGPDCCLSGLENLCEGMIAAGERPEDVAKFCLDYITVSLEGMLHAVLSDHPDLPVLFAGGVMSNSLIRDYFTATYGALFAKPAFSPDNAAGTAVLTHLKVVRG